MTIAYDKIFPTNKRTPANLRIAFARLRQLVHRLVAAAIARRTCAAGRSLLHHFSDQQLKDIGLTRSEIGAGMREAAERRSQLQAMISTNGTVGGSRFAGHCATSAFVPRRGCNDR